MKQGYIFYPEQEVCGFKGQVVPVGVNCRLLEAQFQLRMLQLNVSGDNVFEAKLTQSEAHRLHVQKGQNY